jgi:hypothetical protein
MVTRTEAFPSRWLGPADFPKPATLEIVDTHTESVRGSDGRSVQKLAVYFRNQQKALLVNATNFDVIATVTGQFDSDNWPGHAIELFATTTAMAGRMVPCLRVRAPGAASKKTASKKTAEAFIGEPDPIDIDWSEEELAKAKAEAEAESFQ